MFASAQTRSRRRLTLAGMKRRKFLHWEAQAWGVRGPASEYCMYRFEPCEDEGLCGYAVAATDLPLSFFAPAMLRTSDALAQQLWLSQRKPPNQQPRAAMTSEERQSQRNRVIAIQRKGRVE